MKVEMQVPERYLPNLKPGGTFTLRAATSQAGEEVTGEVYFVSPRIDEQTRSTLVKGYVSNPPPFLKPGMFANITLVLRTVENALVVPETAILSTPRGTVLIKPAEKDGAIVAEFVPVKTGLRIPGYVQITPVGPPIDRRRLHRVRGRWRPHPVSRSQAQAGRAGRETRPPGSHRPPLGVIPI